MRIGRSRVGRGLQSDAGDDAVDSDGLIGAAPPDRSQASGPPFGMPPSLPNLPPGSAADPVDVAPRFRPWSEPAPVAAGPVRCHFLRSVGPDGRLAEAQKTAVPTHRCAAFGDPLPLSLRQQELVCLQRVHVSCPRYVRGTVLANETAAPAAQTSRRKGFPVMTAAAAVLVIAALGILLTGPVLGIGPFAGHAAAPVIANVTASPTAAATAVTVPATPTPAPTPTVKPTSAPTPTPTATAKATATPAPTPTPAATPTPAPTANGTWPPGATASRMNQVTPCPNQANCYIYIVLKGNVLAAIANYFGVDLAKIREMNGLGNSNVIVTGQALKIPPPTK